MTRVERYMLMPGALVEVLFGQEQHVRLASGAWLLLPKGRDQWRCVARWRCSWIVTHVVRVAVPPAVRTCTMSIPCPILAALPLIRRRLVNCPWASVAPVLLS